MGFRSNGPAARVLSGLAYDEKRDVVVLFGGYTESGSLADTWEWDGKSWTCRCPDTHPPARHGHEMYYDSLRGKVVLYGGYNQKKFFNDAWEWIGDECTWKEIELEDDSPVASYYALAYDPDRDYALGLLSGFPGGTWMFKDHTWMVMSPRQEPGNRGGTTLVYDPQNMNFIVFGGESRDVFQNDTWIFDGGGWTRYPDGGSRPEVRADMVIWHDRVRGHVMLYGGNNDKVTFDDMWEFIPLDE